MSTKQELVLKSYSDVLRDCGVFDPSGEGFLCVINDGVQKPVTISKKRLCLPVKALLREGDWEHRIPFHPLCEQINQGPSPVLNALKNYIHFRLTETIKLLAKELYTLAATPARHSDMTAEESVLFQHVTGVDQKAVDHLVKVLASVAEAPEKRILTMILKNGGDKGALRTCVVTFPIFDNAEDGDATTFFGVTGLRKNKPAEKKLLVGLFEYILGDAAQRATYTAPSSDREAPYYHSLLLAFHRLAARLQTLISRHRKSCPALESVEFELAWSEMLEHFGEFAHKNGSSIPPLPGNKGVSATASKKDSVFDAEDADVGMIDSKESESERRREHRDDRRDDRRREEDRRERDRRDDDRRDDEHHRNWRRDDRREESRQPDIERGNGPRHASWRDKYGRDTDRSSDRNERGRSRRDDRSRRDGGGRW